MSANTQPRFDRAQSLEQNAVIARLQHGFAAHLLSEPLSVTRWLMYGQARLYVKTQQGTPIGWVDVRTGERVIEVPDLQPAFEAAIAAVQPGIPADYTPRRALLESVEATHRPKGDGPVPRRSVADPEAPVWAPVERESAQTSGRKGHRSAGTPSARPTPAVAEPAVSTSKELAVLHTDRFRFGRVDALADRYQLWRGASEMRLVARQLNAISRRNGWDYLTQPDLGLDDAAVDFVVGGPGGLFVIDVITPTTPTFRGTGFAKLTSQVLTRAMESAVWVRHILVPVGFSVAQAALLPAELPLVPRRQLTTFLLGQPEVLSPDQVELALGYARLRWTWRS